jgi:molecular chaperone DnaJ
MPSPSGARGDEHVRVVVETPVELSGAQRELLERFAGESAAASTPRRREFLALLKGGA